MENQEERKEKIAYLSATVIFRFRRIECLFCRHGLLLIIFASEI